MRVRCGVPWLLALSTLSMLSSTTVTAEPLTLSHVITLAQTQAPEAQAAAARIAVDEAQRDRAVAQGLPSVSVSAQVAPGGQVTMPLLSQDESALCTAGNLACSVGAAPVGSARASTGVDLRWRVFDFGATDAFIDAREQSLAASRVRSEGTTLSVVGRAVKLFLAVIADDELVHVRERLAQDRLQQAGVVKARAAAGDTSPADVLQAEVAAEAAAFDVEVARTQARVDRIALLAALGLEVDAAADVAVAGGLDVVLATPLERLDPMAHPEVRAARLDEAAARQSAVQAERGRLPTVDATASVGATLVAITKPDANLTPSAGMGLSLAWPVLSFSLDADARAAAASRVVAEKTRQARTVAIIAEQQRAQAQLVAQEALVVRATRLRTSARYAVDIVVGRLEAGAARLPELLDAQASLTAAEATLVQARAARAAAVVDLALASGTIDTGTFGG
jgi:multidrug efflux system outer membrane protein